MSIKFWRIAKYYMKKSISRTQIFIDIKMNADINHYNTIIYQTKTLKKKLIKEDDTRMNKEVERRIRKLK